MRKQLFVLGSLLAAAALVLTYQAAFAHTTVTVGDYEVEVGWVDEPPVVGQRNAVVVNVSKTASPDAEVDVSNLSVAVSYGGETKNLTLEPLSEDTVNQYIAPILPTVAGQYTVQLRGKLDGTDISQDVQPEEVAAADELEFPSAAAAGMPSAGAGGPDWSEWLGVVALIAALAALAVGITAARKPR